MIIIAIVIITIIVVNIIIFLPILAKLWNLRLSGQYFRGNSSLFHFYISLLPRYFYRLRPPVRQFLPEIFEVVDSNLGLLTLCGCF